MDKLLQEIRRIKYEAQSDYNDGWTKEHYKRQLDEIRELLNDT